VAAVALTTLATACTGEVSSDEYLARAETALAENDNASAIIELKNALKSDADNGRARLLLGLAYFEAGDSRSAEKELLLAEGLQSSEARSDQQATLARVWGDLAKYEDIFGMSLQDLTPEARAVVVAAKGQAYLARSDVESAQQRIDSALEIDPDSAYALYVEARLLAVQGENEAARSRLDKVLVLEPDFALAWSLRGDVDWRLDDREAAEKDYSRAVELARGTPFFRMKRAFSRINTGDFEAAQQDLDVLLGLAPESTQINYAQGLLHIRQGNNQDAIAPLLIAEADKFSFPDVLLYLGVAYGELGEIDKAFSYAREFHALDENNLAGNRLLAGLLVGRGSYAEAETMARQLLETNPKDVSALNTLASALMSQQRTDEAIVVLNQVVQLDPESAQAQVRLGAGYLSAGRTEEAVDLVENAVELDPESGQPDTVLVYTHMRAGEYEKALRVANEYAQRKPDIPQPRLLQGVVEQKMGDIDAARRSFQYANELEPGQPAANHHLAAMAFAERDLDTARGYYQAVLEENKDFLPSLIALAALEGFARNFDEMEKQLRAAIEAHPEALRPRLALARYYLAAGRNEQVQVAISGLPAEISQSPAVQRVRAQAQLALRDYAAAEAGLDALVQGEDATVQDRQLMAYALQRQEKWPEAKRQLLLALDQEPDNLPVRLSLARNAFGQGDQDAINEHMKVLKKLAPESPQVIQLQAALARKDGDQERALALFQKAQELKPGTAGMINLLQQYDLMADSEGALALLESWSESNASDTTAKGLLALRLQEQGDTDSAIAKYEEFLELDPDNVAALNNLAWILKDTDSDRALEYARKADDLSGGMPAVRDTLAMIMVARGELDDGAGILAELRQAQPENPSFQYHQAIVEVERGNTDTARELLEKLIAGNPQFPELDEAQALLAKLR